MKKHLLYLSFLNFSSIAFSAEKCTNLFEDRSPYVANLMNQIRSITILPDVVKIPKNEIDQLIKDYDLDKFSYFGQKVSKESIAELRSAAEKISIELGINADEIFNVIKYSDSGIRYVMYVLSIKEPETQKIHIDFLSIFGKKIEINEINGGDSKANYFINFFVDGIATRELQTYLIELTKQLKEKKEMSTAIYDAAKSFALKKGISAYGWVKSLNDRLRYSDDSNTSLTDKLQKLIAISKRRDLTGNEKQEFFDQLKKLQTEYSFLGKGKTELYGVYTIGGEFEATFSTQNKFQLDPSAPVKPIKLTPVLIAPGKGSPLNRFAKQLWDKYKVVVAYDPWFLSLFDARGAFLKYAKLTTSDSVSVLEKYRGFVGVNVNEFGNAGILFLPHDAISDLAHSDVTTHEIRHVLSEMERKGLYIPKVRAPVHGYFRSLKKNQSLSAAYSGRISFEELVNFAENITGLAKKSRDSQNYGSSDRTELANDIRILMRISLSIRDAARRPYMYSRKDIDFASFDFGRQNEFDLTLTPPEAILKDIRDSSASESAKKEQLEEYLSKQLEDLANLANFNLEYFKDYSGASSWKLDALTPEQLEHIRNFKREQVKFLESLQTP